MRMSVSTYKNSRPPAIAVGVSPLTVRKTCVLAGGETLTYREMGGCIFDGLGRPRIFIPIPSLLWRAAMPLAKLAIPHVTAETGLRRGKDLTFDNSPAERDFGWHPRKF